MTALRNSIVMRLVLCAVLSATLCGTAAGEVVAYHVYVTTEVRQPVDFEVPVLLGPSGSALAASVDASTLQFGTLEKVHDWKYKYTPTAAGNTLLNGAEDECMYTLSDGTGFSTSAKIFITINPIPAPATVDMRATTGANAPINITTGDLSSLQVVIRLGTPKYGSAVVLSNASPAIVLYTPAASKIDPKTGALDPFTYTVTDTFGRTSTALITVEIKANRPPSFIGLLEYSMSRNDTITITVISEADPGRLVVDDDGDSVSVTSYSTPKYGSVTKLRDGVYNYTALPGVDAIDFDPDRYLREEIIFTLSDGRGGLTDAIANMKLEDFRCRGVIGGKHVVPGQYHEFDDKNIPGCGGTHTVTNCFNGYEATAENVFCEKMYPYLEIQDAYGTNSHYRERLGYKSWSCVVRHRATSCSDKSDPSRTGFVTWQSLASTPCAYACQVITGSVENVVAGGACQGCTACTDDCEKIPGIQPVGYIETCCITDKTLPDGPPDKPPSSPGVPPRPSPSPGNTTDCQECSQQPSEVVCGSDGIVYGSPCLATCQGVTVASMGPCPGSTYLTNLLDTADPLPSFTSEVSQAFKELRAQGYQVLGMAKTGEAPTADGGYDFLEEPSSSDDSQDAALGKKKLVPNESHFQALIVTSLSIKQGGKDKFIVGLSKKSQSEVYRLYNIHVLPDAIAGPPTESWTTELTFASKESYKIEDYPFTAIGMLGRLIKGKVVGFCTGYVISTSVKSVWVMTAAHCVHKLKTGLTANPTQVRFYPQVHAGKLADGFNGEEGYPVRSIILPSWWVQLPAGKKSPLRVEEYWSWDMALLKLQIPGSKLPCPQSFCRLALGYVVKGSQLLRKFRVAGYGKPHTKQLRYSAPCELRLSAGTQYEYHNCPTYKGHSGAPVYLHGIPPYNELPKGVAAYIWPAMGVHHGKDTVSKRNAFTKFTYAHLAWVYYTGVDRATYYGCTGSARATCGKAL